MNWYYFLFLWEAYYKQFQEEFTEEIEIYETSRELDMIDYELDEMEAEVDALLFVEMDSNNNL